MRVLEAHAAPGVLPGRHHHTQGGGNRDHARVDNASTWHHSHDQTSAAAATLLRYLIPSARGLGPARARALSTAHRAAAGE